MSLRAPLQSLADRLLHSRWSPLRTVVGFRTEAPLVALTFDDGPDPEHTPPLLDVLDRYGARATFFMVGEAARDHPELVREVADRGHAIGNHTFTHPSFAAVDGSRRRAEIRRCDDALSPFGADLFRPPHGHQSPSSRLDVLRCGHEVVAWSADVDDWNPHEAGWFAARLRERAGPGRIVLLHDGLWDPSGPAAADRTPVVRGVEMFLEETADRYRFETLPVLMETASPIREGWFRGPAREEGR